MEVLDNQTTAKTQTKLKKIVNETISLSILLKNSCRSKRIKLQAQYNKNQKQLQGLLIRLFNSSLRINFGGLTLAEFLHFLHFTLVFYAN